MIYQVMLAEILYRIYKYHDRRKLTHVSHLNTLKELMFKCLNNKRDLTKYKLAILQFIPLSDIHFILTAS